MTCPQKPLMILLIEDNLADIELAYEVLEETNFSADIQVVRDGIEALELLGSMEHTLPDLILLDLNLPRMNGFKLLEKLKQEPSFRTIPVIVLSTSEAPHDINQSYELGSNCFITKPSSFEDYVATMSSIKSFWGTVAKLPHRAK